MGGKTMPSKGSEQRAGVGGGAYTHPHTRSQALEAASAHSRDTRRAEVDRRAISTGRMPGAVGSALQGAVAAEAPGESQAVQTGAAETTTEDVQVGVVGVGFGMGGVAYGLGVTLGTGSEMGGPAPKHTKKQVQQAAK